MKRNDFKFRGVICGTLLFFFLTGAFFTLSGEPVVIKGVDGTWLPVLASSWTERNNGVILKPHKSVDPQILRTKLLDRFPDMNIEIINKDLFFPSINVESLFSIIAGVDLDLNRQSETKSLWSDPSVTLQKNQDTKDPLSGEDVIGAKVHSVSFDSEKGEMTIDITITERALKGKFRRYFGKQRIKISFVMKEGAIDNNNVQNKKFGRLLLLKEDSVLTFTPVEFDVSTKAFIISDFYIVRL